MSNHESRFRLARVIPRAFNRAAGAKEELKPNLLKPSLFRVWLLLVVGMGLIATMIWVLFVGWLAFGAVVWVTGLFWSPA